MLSYLKSKIEIIPTKNKAVFISKQCIFSGYISKNRLLRYNSKLKVVKCFHCGKSAKSLYWLKLQVEKPMKAQIISIKNDRFIEAVWKQRAKEYKDNLIKNIKDKASAFDRVIVKPADENLPF